ncbi:MAG: hypothetical protein EZS28_020752 [Streblomastix strix]|uniref:General transcription and DNA repair factor IIH subunit TFB5 n=1 Tax=Streblomastix strix TaxID=222440 RepID=A0A5J4VN85_9EUKA|nr:MAG: hypothetical protein EZS28_020752 [Streblomastix strix]
MSELPMRHGTLITCSDAAVTELLTKINEEQKEKFILDQLDETHLFIKSNALKFVEEQLALFLEADRKS